MPKQKFFLGDLVQVADDLGISMRHFPAGCQAIVLGSYAELCSGDDPHDVDSLRLFILPKEIEDDNIGEHSWYRSDQLTLIAPDRFHLLPLNHRARLNYEAKKARDSK